ncbi:MAG: enolase C-terminal domain-like protein [Anaerolineae bacterium]|nr:enolase C-terminal domain-like protein [Anaerolineae bacterium]
MHITSIKATVVQERVLWARPIESIFVIRTNKLSPRQRRMPWPGSVLVEIESDEGITGVGLGGGGKAGAIAVEHYLSPLLLGENPLDISRLWELMYRASYRYGQAGLMIMAISALDLALWDLKGKALRQPVWQLLGGKARDKVPVYATIRDPEWAKAQGFTGVKLGGPYGPQDGAEGLRLNEAAIASIRERVGSDFDIMLDCARTWDVEYTLNMARLLAPYHIKFIEEPILSHDIDGYCRLRRSIDSTLIACGEHVFTRYGAKLLLEKGAIDIIQPDIRWTGGLSECMKICDLAAAYNIPVMPHRGGMAWSLPMIMAHPSCTLAEGLVLTPEEAAYSIFDGEPVPENGFLTVSNGPGFDLTLVHDRIVNFPSDI